MQWLDTFKLARTGDAKAQAILSRYDKFLVMKTEKNYWEDLVLDEMVRLPSSPESEQYH